MRLEGRVGVRIGLLPSSTEQERESPTWTPLSPLRRQGVGVQLGLHLQSELGRGDSPTPSLLPWSASPGRAHVALGPWCPSGLPLPEPSKIFDGIFRT